MKRLPKLTISVALAALLVLSTSVTAGTIEGIVTDEKDPTKPLEFINVQFFDAQNAELVSSASTGTKGNYSSGTIPEGDYRVRYSDPGQYTPGFFLPEFSGAAGKDLFCEGAVYSLGARQTIFADESMRFSSPVLVVIRNFSFTGAVTDSITGRPVEGIIVEFRNGTNGLPVAATKGGGITTDVNGEYNAIFDVRISPTVKVRFFDPSGRYFPEYADQASRTDDFCNGTAYLGDMLNIVNATLDVVPADQQVQVIIDTIDSLALPNDVQNSLGTPLIRAVDLLTDTNHMNDNAVCGKLGAFISRVDIMERQGRLGLGDAATLRQLAIALFRELGC
jgi:hypothetical protein